MANPDIVPHINALQRAVERDELAVALAVADLIPAAVRPAAGRDLIDSFWLALDADEPEAAGASPREGVLGWFKARGFGAVPPGAHTFAHSHLPGVVDTSQGLPIAVAVLVVEGLRRRGVDAAGINYPGHFLLRADDVLVDPLTLDVVPPDALSNDPHAFGVASPRVVGMRMINNLKALHLQSRDWHHALDLVDVQLALVEEDDAEANATLYFERAELWQQLGARDAAMQALVDCLAAAPPPKLAAVAQARLDRLRETGGGGSPQTYH